MTAIVQSTAQIETKENVQTLGLYLQDVGTNKNKKAFSKLFDYYGGRLKSFYIKQGLNAETAEELVQEVFVLIWRKADQFDPSKANASTWIYTIARNKRIDYLRKDIKRLEDPVEFLPDIEDDDKNNPEEKVIQSNISDRIKDIINILPKDQKQIILQSYFQGLTHQDIANKNKIPIGTVKSRLRLAMQRLQKGWKFET